ncbi:MAG: GH25 family lysozyme [Acidobacteriota bacterium]|nr:GH25 family lysozyme [Acidobacteriota bacterium]
MRSFYQNLGTFLLILLCMVPLACGEGPPAEAPAPSAASTPAKETPPPAPAPPQISPQEVVDRLHQGVDVSVHSGAVDWQAVADAGHHYAYLKATEGVDLKDSAFDDHWQRAKEAGLVRGAYHFYVTEDDPEEQAQFFIENVELRPGDLVPVVDVEVLGHGTEPGLPNRLRRFLEIIEDHYGVKPMIYTSPNFWNRHVATNFGDYPLWIAEYGVEQPQLPNGWDDWHLWQWEDDPQVPGVEKDADRSHLNRERSDLHRLVIPGPAATEEASGPEVES